MRKSILIAVALVLVVGTICLGQGQKKGIDWEDLSHFEKGVMLRREGRYEEALKEYLREIEENPENHGTYFSMALLHRDMGNFYKEYLWYKRYVDLDPTSPWADEARRRMELMVKEGKVIFEGVRVEEVEVGDIFPSVYKSYTVVPVGYMRLRNRSEGVLRNIRTSFFIKGYMDYPTEVEVAEELAPDEEVEGYLYAGLRNSVLELREDAVVSSALEVSFSEGEKTLKKSKVLSVTIRNRNAFIWDDQEKLASFVTAKDPVIKTFAGNIVKGFKDYRVSFIEDKLFKAMQVYDALSVYGIEYIEDPKNPYRLRSEEFQVIDYVQYPIETLRRGTGDCDDSAVLYAAVLESLGISTAFVDLPGHVFSMFDTGLSLDEREIFSPYSDLLIEHGGRLWVPIETTLWGSPFRRAWRSAARRYRSTPEEEREIIEVEEAWKVYGSVTVEVDGWKPSLPPLEGIGELISSEVEGIYREKVSYIRENYRELLEAQREDYVSQNELGVVYALNGLYEEAVGAFERALKVKGDFLKARINLGYAYYMLGMYDESIEMLSGVLEEVPEDAQIHFYLGLIYQEKQDYEDARREIESAMRLDSSYREVYEDMRREESRGGASQVRGWRPGVRDWRRGS